MIIPTLNTSNILSSVVKRRKTVTPDNKDNLTIVTIETSLQYILS